MTTKAWLYDVAEALSRARRALEAAYQEARSSRARTVILEVQGDLTNLQANVQNQAQMEGTP